MNNRSYIPISKLKNYTADVKTIAWNPNLYSFLASEVTG